MGTLKLWQLVATWDIEGGVTALVLAETEKAAREMVCDISHDPSWMQPSEATCKLIPTDGPPRVVQWLGWDEQELQEVRGPWVS